MAKPTDIRAKGATLYLLPLSLRIPLKFGAETVTWVTCARVSMRVEDSRGRSALGWGETPLSVQWVWPSSAPYEERHKALIDFCSLLCRNWVDFDCEGHPIEIGHEFLEDCLPKLVADFNRHRPEYEPMPWLAALVCCSAFDLATHDAFGQLHKIPVYSTYTAEFMNRDLSTMITPHMGRPGESLFKNKYPADFLTSPRTESLAAWHLVGGKDLLQDEERMGDEPDDGYPVTLTEWIRRDGLWCLKVKLRGNDALWDYERLTTVGRISLENDIVWLTADFNCTVTDPVYVTGILDRLMLEHPRIYGMLLYVEQPFPYDLETHQIEVHSVSARKPLFMDESAHDWRLLELGRKLGWTGVALKTCKTQTGALLSLCWAKAHGMTLMVQDLTNPMLAQIPHLLLAAHAGTIMGVETNGMQFYPQASLPEAATHPGAYQRTGGCVDLRSISGPGFGYRLEEIQRTLPEPLITS
ncbi:MAG: hypothetical protein K9N62_16880 [Verrucomicrobia bacterium]|nr:hypothetical protein [Verrucomicrobiota bacterium]